MLYAFHEKEQLTNFVFAELKKKLPKLSHTDFSETGGQTV